MRCGSWPTYLALAHERRDAAVAASNHQPAAVWAGHGQHTAAANRYKRVQRTALDLRRMHATCQAQGVRVSHNPSRRTQTSSCACCCPPPRLIYPAYGPHPTYTNARKVTSGGASIQPLAIRRELHARVLACVAAGGHFDRCQLAGDGVQRPQEQLAVAGGAQQVVRRGSSLDVCGAQGGGVSPRWHGNAIAPSTAVGNTCTHTAATHSSPCRRSRRCWWGTGSWVRRR